MEENAKFNLGQRGNLRNEMQFKKERAAYLAQRNARKKEAEMMMKIDVGHTNSSDDDQIHNKKNTQTIKFQQTQGDNKTNSDKNQRQPKKDRLKEEREIYMAERAAHRREMVRNQQIEPGLSSSDDEQKMPVYKSELVIPQTISHELYKRHSLKQELQVGQQVSKMQKDRQNNLHSSVKLKVQNAEKKSHRERYQIEVPSKKGVNIWLEQFLQFKENAIEIGQRLLPIYDICKTKLFFIRTESGSYKMKVTYKDEDIFFAINHKKINQLCLDHYYYLFAKIITLKLQLMGKKPIQHSHQSRSKLGLSEKQLNGAQISGKVRKSSFFGGWEQNVGVVNQLGLSIYKQGKEKPVLTISYNSIRELWTRFQFDGDNLVVKLLHNSSKMELSIPFENYLSRDNWLYHLYNLASK